MVCMASDTLSEPQKLFMEVSTQVKVSLNSNFRGQLEIECFIYVDFSCIFVFLPHYLQCSFSDPLPPSRKYVYKSLFLGYKKCQTFQLFEDVYNLNRELSFPFKVPKAFPLKNSFTTDFLCVVSEFILQGVPILHLEKLPLNPFVLWAKKNLLEVRKYSAKSKSKSCGEISQVKVFTVQSQQVILYMNLGTFYFFCQFKVPLGSRAAKR